MHSDVRNADDKKPTSSTGLGALPDYTMTEEEEAALLAEYGVAGAYDALLGIPAASHFKSEVDNSPDVFLTGARVSDADTSVIEPFSRGEHATTDELLHDPIDALLLKYTSSFAAGAPNSLVDNVAAVADASASRTKRRRRSDGSLGAVTNSNNTNNNSTPELRATSKFCKELAEAKREEACAFRAVCAWGVAEEQQLPASLPAAAAVADGAHADTVPTEDVVRESEALLRRATEALERNTHLDPTTDPVIQQRLAAMESTLATEALGEVDDVLQQELDQGDAEMAEILSTAQRLIARHRRTSGNANEKGGADDGGGNADAPENAPREHGAADFAVREWSLFAFDMEPTTEEREELQQWEAIREATLQRKEVAPSPLADTESPSSASHPQVPPEPDRVLADLDVLEGKQAATLTAIEAHYRSRIKVAKADAMTRAVQQAQEGFLVMEPFADRIGHLLPSTISSAPQHVSAPLQAYALSSQQSGYAVVEATRPPPPTAVETTTADITRRAARQLWLVQREAKEAKRMRQEDKRVSDHIAQQEAALELARELLRRAEDTCAEERLAMAREQAAAFDELLARERRHRDLTRRALLIRETKAAAALAEEIAREHDAAMRVLEGEEAREREMVFADMARSLVVARKSQAAREAAELAAAQEEERRCRLAYAAKKMRCMTAVVSGGEQTRACGSMLSTTPTRAALIAEEKETILAWVRTHATALRETERWLEEEEVGRPCVTTRGTIHDVLPPHMDLPDASSCAAVAGEQVVLDASTFAKLLPQHFALVGHDGPYRASQGFHTVSLALNDISGINYASLQQCSLSRDGTTTTTRVTDLVHQLDLSGNRLSDSLALPLLLRVFPALEQLNLADNQLKDLLGATSTESPPRDGRPGSSTASSSPPARSRGTAAAQLNALAERCRLQDLDVSLNELHDLAPLGDYLSSSLVTLSMCANKLTTLSTLQRCQRLATVVANRNRVRTLSDVRPLRLLQELNLCDNDVEDFDEAVAQHNALLTRLFLSHNPRLRSLPSGGGACFLFLEQLFLNHCGLERITVGSFPWMPSLSVLHVEGNQLSDVSGLVKALRLTRVNLAFNRLATVDTLKPLRLCHLMDSLDVRGNALLAADADVSAVVALSFPCLREFNNEPFTPAATASAVEWSIGNGTSEDFFAALTDMRTQRELASIYSCRRVRVAEAYETARDEDVRRRGADNATATVTDGQEKLLSLQMTKEARRDAAARIRTCLAALLDLSERTSDATPNRHCVNQLFAERKREARERHARAVIRRALHDAVAIRQARRELARLRKAFHESESYRREAAVRRIQPVWRGAALRSRLARILGKGMGSSAEDFDGYEKVDVAFPEEDKEALRPATIADLLRHALASEDPSRGAWAEAPAFDRFDVPATVVGPSTARGVATSDVLTLATPPPYPPLHRAGSAPDAEAGLATVRNANMPMVNGRLRPSGQAASPRPSSQPQAPRPPAPRPQQQPQEQQAAPDPAWGATVAAQIQKKNAKMRRAHQEHVRSEFLTDPLNAKKMASTSQGRRS